MSSAPTVDELIERNKVYSQTHPAQPFISERQSLGIPSPKTMIITCMDARVIPEKFMNLKYGEAIVLRNAGGRVEFALRDIAAIDIFLNLVNLIVIHHTDCGTIGFRDEKIQSVLLGRAPDHEQEIRKMTFGQIKDVDRSVVDDVEWIKGCPYIRKELKDRTQGMSFDITTGLLKKVA